MKRNDYTIAINELSASERIFTTAQAARFGVPRNVLAKACDGGKLVRIAQGAYRLAGVPASHFDGIEAAWKLTAPSKMTHERMPADAWDGITIAGTTAASILGIGDFYLSPYRILSPKRINSRNPDARFGVRAIAREDVSFHEGFPVTRIERTLLDLALDNEEPSLVQDALANARKHGLDEERLEQLVVEALEKKEAAQRMADYFGKG